MNFANIVFYDYSKRQIDSDIQKLLETGAYRPSYAGLVRAFLTSEIRNFYRHFGPTGKQDLSIEYIGSVCDDRAYPDPQKFNDFLAQNDISDKAEQLLLKKTTVSEAFGSGFIRNYQTSKGKSKAVYFYDMPENPFYSVYTFCHEMTHALQDKNHYGVYDLDKKGMADYREIHANLTAATFMMVKALQTDQSDVVRQTAQNLEHLSAKMSNVMKNPRLGVRYFDWKGLKAMLTEIPDHYQSLLDKSGQVDWNRLYTYTAQKVLQMDYTPQKVTAAKKLLSDKIVPVWQSEQAAGNNASFFNQIRKFQGQNEIVDDFLDAFPHTLNHAGDTEKMEQFHQMIANPLYRESRLLSSSFDGISNISAYREMYPGHADRPIYEFIFRERLADSKTGQTLWQDYLQTGGYELTKELPLEKLGQFIGGPNSRVLINSKYPDSLYFYALMHETAHARQRQKLGILFPDDPGSDKISPKELPVLNAVIEADAEAKGLVALIKSYPAEKEISDLRENIPHLSGAIDYLLKHKDADDTVLLQDSFTQLYAYWRTNLKEKPALSVEQKYLSRILNDSLYGNHFLKIFNQTGKVSDTPSSARRKDPTYQ